MAKYISCIVGAVAAMALAPSASAMDFVPGNPQFQVSGNIASGPVSAAFGNSGIASGNFQDRYLFTIDQTGTGSGTLATSTVFGGVGSATDLDITSVTINGFVATKFTPDALTEFFSINNVPIVFGVLNSIVVTGTSRGNGSYGGNATFQPAVPEAGTWAMMLIGFGALGSVMRYRRRSTRVAFAA